MCVVCGCNQEELLAPRSMASPRVPLSGEGAWQMDGQWDIRSHPSNYIVKKVVGRGVFGVVCQAVSLFDQRPVALKKIQIFEMTDSKARLDCLKEISLLQNLDHPNIIKYLGSFVENGELNIVLELAGAGDLSCMISCFRKSHRLIPEPTIWKYFVQICAGLHHMHSKRIMHRDIKPANVFVTVTGVVKLGDLGLSRYFSCTTIAAHSLVGTPYYMSPERLSEKGYTFNSDIWSLGCLLYELAALQSPFFCRHLNLFMLTKKIQRADYPPIPSKIYSEKIRGLVDSCLRAEPERRPNIEEVHQKAKLMWPSLSPPLANSF